VTHLWRRGKKAQVWEWRAEVVDHSEIYEGTNQVQRMVIARSLLK